MFRDTNYTCNEIKRFSSRSNERERANGIMSNIICYKCNNFGHISINCKAPVNQNGPNQRRSTLVCQLCNNFGQIARLCRMDMRNINMNPNYRRNTIINVRRNDSRNNSKKDELREHVEESKEVFVKAKDPSSSQDILEEQYFDGPNKSL